jgi:hypothetical protein
VLGSLSYSDILIIKGTIVIVRAAGEMVSLIGGAGLVHKFKVEFGHFGEIVGNMATDFVGVTIVFQVQVIGQDSDFVGGAHKEVTPSE